MCTGAVMNARLSGWYLAHTIKGRLMRFYSRPFTLPYNHHPLVVSGILAEDCAAELKRFFKDLRQRRATGGVVAWKNRGCRNRIEGCSFILSI